MLSVGWLFLRFFYLSSLIFLPHFFLFHWINGGTSEDRECVKEWARSEPTIEELVSWFVVTLFLHKRSIILKKSVSLQINNLV